MERFLQRTYPLLFYLEVPLLHLEVPLLHLEVPLLHLEVPLRYYFPLLVSYSLLFVCGLLFCFPFGHFYGTRSRQLG